MSDDIGATDDATGTAEAADGAEAAEPNERTEPTENPEVVEGAQVAEATQAQAVPGIAPSTQGRLPVTFWPALALGWGLIGFGVRNAYRKASGLGNPHGLGRWVVSGLIVHDGFWAPVAVAVGWLSARWLPPPVRSPVRIGLALTAMLVVVFAPVYRRYGALADNSSVDPNNSGVALLVLVGLLWAALSAASVVRIRRARP